MAAKVFQAYIGRFRTVVAMVVVRLIKRDRLKAVLTLADRQPRTWTEAEVKLVEEVAERVWTAIERANAEAALRKSEERYHLMALATNDVIYDWSAVTGRLEWNEAAFSTFGYTLEELGSTIESATGGKNEFLAMLAHELRNPLAAMSNAGATVYLFGQVEPGLDRAQGGIGIGLTIVKNLVQLHGGNIEVHSEGLGQGAEFTVTLPRLLVQEIAEPKATASGPSDNRAKRILIVENSPDVAETLSMLLEAAGHEVATVNNGLRAPKKAEEFVPDRVLLDIGLPGMDGYEVARRLRKNSRTHNLVLAALTGYGQDSDRALAEAAGFNAHFVKPVDFIA